MATKIIGLDLGSHTVKTCELVTTFRNLELVGFDFESVRATSDGVASFDDRARAAYRLLERRGVLGETIICALPSGLASTIILDLPFDQPKKLEAVLPFQLDEALPVDIEDIVYDYQVIGRTEAGGSEVLVAYTKRTDLTDLLMALEEAGLDPKQITIGPLAVAKLHPHLSQLNVPTTTAVVDLGHQFTQLTILHNGEPRVVRNIAGGGQAINKNLADVFQVDATDAERGKLSEANLAASAEFFEPESREAVIDRACRDALNPVVRELKRSIAAFEANSGQTVSEVALTGGTSLLRGITTYIEKALGRRVTILNSLQVPFNRLNLMDDSSSSLMARALGLGVQGSSRSRSDVNLRKEEFAYTGDFGFLRGRIIATGLAIIMMILLGSMAAISQKRVLEAEYDQLRRDAIAMSTEILGAESDDVDLLLSTVMATSDSSGNAIPDASAFRLLAAISREVDEDLKIDVDRIEVDVARKSLKIRGKTGSGGDVERIVDALRKTECFKQIKKERVEKSVDDRTRFRLSATSTCT